MRNFYLVATIIGTVVPWIFFAQFIGSNSVNLWAFLAGLYANGAAGGFASDIFITAAVFWVWSYLDSQKTGVANWWLVIPATLCVGLSMALPLYLYLREGADAA